MTEQEIYAKCLALGMTQAALPKSCWAYYDCKLGYSADNV